jgi:hypothetical protein
MQNELEINPQIKPQIEISTKPQIVEDLSSPYIEIKGKESVFFDANILGVDKWPQMLKETEDGRERLMVVSKRNGKNYFSDIYSGLSEKQNKGNNAEVYIPLFPQGLKSLLPGMEDVLTVHTHHMVKLDEVQTTIISDADITNFVNCKDYALVMIDRGGAHILVRTEKTYNSRELIDKEIVDRIQHEIAEKNRNILDVIKLVSKELSHYGIGYLYTPNLTPDPKGYVEFFDPNKVPEKLTKQNFTALSPDIHTPLP